MEPRTLVVIGGSAAAVETLIAVLRQLPADFVPICVALHFAPLRSEWLSAHVANPTQRRVASPEGEQPIEAGHVQHPQYARHPTLPRTALANVQVDHRPHSGEHY